MENGGNRNKFLGIILSFWYRSKLLKELFLVLWLVKLVWRGSSYDLEGKCNLENIVRKIMVVFFNRNKRSYGGIVLFSIFFFNYDISVGGI